MSSDMICIYVYVCMHDCEQCLDLWHMPSHIKISSHTEMNSVPGKNNQIAWGDVVSCYSTKLTHYMREVYDEIKKHEKYMYELCLSLTLYCHCMEESSFMMEWNIAFHIVNFMAFGDSTIFLASGGTSTSMKEDTVQPWINQEDIFVLVYQS